MLAIISMSVALLISDSEPESQQRGRAEQPGGGAHWPGQADQPAEGAEGPRREGHQGGEGAPRAGTGRVQNEDSHLWLWGKMNHLITNPWRIELVFFLW